MKLLLPVQISEEENNNKNDINILNKKYWSN